MKFSMQPLFDALKSKAQRMTGVYRRKRLSPNPDGNAAGWT